MSCCLFFLLGRADGDGRAAKMSLWNNPGNDTTGTVARMRKVADTAEALLGGEVCMDSCQFVCLSCHLVSRFLKMLSERLSKKRFA